MGWRTSQDRDCLPFLASPYSIRKHHVQADSHASEFGSILAACGLSTLRPGPELRSRDRDAPSGGRSPRPARPGSTERIRFFDVKHIKAELTIDTQKREVRGMVTHTLSPLHPYLTQRRARLRAQAQGQPR